MAGTPGRSGRLPEIGIADGTDEVLPIAARSARIEKPTFGSPEASELWDVLSVELIDAGKVRSEDAAMLQSVCELWGLYRASYACAFRHPTDKDSRIAVTSYWGKFEQAAARFGLNPVDRQRMKATPTKTGVRRRQA